MSVVNTIVTPLKPFQNNTVEWMINQEKHNSGGFLLNEAGTGKTICCISLVIKNLQKQQKTLIVCPAGLIQNWENEILKHTNIDYTQIIKYTGKNRTNIVEVFNKHSEQYFFITSYSIVSREFDNQNNKFKDNSIFNEKFSRIILDEAHYIRNTNTKIFKSIVLLQAQFKWIVTATPIVNNADDLYAYFRFLEIESIESKKSWNDLTHSHKYINKYKIINNLLEKHCSKIEKQHVLKHELSKKHESIIDINLDPIENEFYQSLWNYSMQRIDKLSKRIDSLHGLGNFHHKTLKSLLTNNILVYILRLKQACNTPWIVIQKMKRLSKTTSLQHATEMLKFYNSSLQENEECPICYDNNADFIADPCGHKCCEHCWSKIEKLGDFKCPKCRTFVNKIENTNHIQHDIQNQQSISLESEQMKYSSKIKSLLNIVKQKIDKGEKIVIVSQWVNMLDIVKDFIKTQLPNTKSICLQGNVSFTKRNSLIYTFQNNAEYNICYLSLMACAEGINLTSANNMVILDSWWNYSKISQVSDRIHRIGQTKQVNIYKLSVTCEHSIEKKITQLITKKERLKNLVVTHWNIQNTDSYDDLWIKDKINLFF